MFTIYNGLDFYFVEKKCGKKIIAPADEVLVKLEWPHTPGTDCT